MEWLSNPLWDRWVLVLLHFVWQGLVIVAGVAILLRLTSPRSASARYLLTLGAFGLLLIAPLFTAAIVEPPPRPEPLLSLEPLGIDFDVAPVDDQGVLQATLVDSTGDRTGAAGDPFAPTSFFGDEPAEFRIETNPAFDLQCETTLAPAPAPPLIALFFRCEPVLLIAWLIGSGLLALRLSTSFVRTLLLRRGRRSPPAELLQRIELLADRLNMSCIPPVYLSTRVGNAIVTGYLRPIILLPLRGSANSLPTSSTR